MAYLGLNDIATFETFFAAGRLGAVFVPLNHRLAATEVDYLLGDCGADVLVCGPGVEALVRELLQRPGGHRPRHVVVVSAIEGVDTDDYEAALTAAGGAGDVVPARPVVLDDVATFLYTSGTTGRPKAAVLTHGNLTWNTVNQLAHLDVLSTDQALCISPLFHAVGLGQITLPMLFKGGEVEVVPRFDPGAVLQLIGELDVASFSCVPTMLQMMTEHPSWSTASLESLRYVVYGGSPVTERTATAWLDRGVRLQQGYGMTEASPGVAMATAAGAAGKPVSVGVAHFFTDLGVLGPGGEASSVAPHVRGELLVRGPHVFAGYWQRAADSSAAMAGPDADWYRTGDVLESDADGWLHVVDRVTDVIISGGENIYPAEIEALLVEHSQVRSAAVVAAPDERWGEVGVAYVEVVPGATLTAEDLLSHLGALIARFKLPREVVVVDHLPRNATGKILRVPLRDDAAHRARPKDTR